MGGLLRGLIALACLLSGLLGLYVGLDYVSRLADLRRFNGGYDLFRALSANGKPLEILQDYGGAHALLFGGDAYVTNGTFVGLYAADDTGALGWTVSTHPPTAFALLLPLATLPFGMASALWAIITVAGPRAAADAATARRQGLYSSRPALAGAGIPGIPAPRPPGLAARIRRATRKGPYLRQTTRLQRATAPTSRARRECQLALAGNAHRRVRLIILTSDSDDRREREMASCGGRLVRSPRRLQ